MMNAMYCRFFDPPRQIFDMNGHECQFMMDRDIAWFCPLPEDEIFNGVVWITITFLAWVMWRLFAMYNYRPEYKDSLKRLHSTIEEIADAQDTSFEYVMKDLYGIHLRNY